MATNKEPLYWVTTKNGKHIPIFDKDPQKNAQILKARREAYLRQHPEKTKQPDAHVEPFIRMKTHLASKGIHSEEEIANYLRGLSATRRSKLAREMGLESRGQDKIREMAHRIYNADKTSPTPSPAPTPTPSSKSTPSPTPSPAPAKPSVNKAVRPEFDYPQYKKILGEKKNIDLSAEVMHEIEKNPEGRRVGSFVNSNYLTDTSPKQTAYHKNCALCTAALALRSQGYDVEAMPRDTTWRGCETVMDFDYSNPDNFLIGGAKNLWDNYTITRTILLKGRRGDIDINAYQRMPIGANQAATAIINKVKHWGDGAVAELSVDWKGRKSGHSIAMMNIGGQVLMFDGQTGRYCRDHASLSQYLKATIASHTELVRVDNAPLLRAGIESQLEKMVRQRTVSSQINAGLNQIDWDKF